MACLPPYLSLWVVFRVLPHVGSLTSCWTDPSGQPVQSIPPLPACLPAFIGFALPPSSLPRARPLTSAPQLVPSIYSPPKRPPPTPRGEPTPPPRSPRKTSRTPRAGGLATRPHQAHRTRSLHNKSMEGETKVRSGIGKRKSATPGSSTPRRRSFFRWPRQSGGFVDGFRVYLIEAAKIKIKISIKIKIGFKEKSVFQSYRAGEWQA